MCSDYWLEVLTHTLHCRRDAGGCSLRGQALLTMEMSALFTVHVCTYVMMCVSLSISLAEAAGLPFTNQGRGGPDPRCQSREPQPPAGPS